MSGLQKLNDNDLETVAGGMLFYAGNVAGADPNRPWEVIDNNNGQTIDRYATKQEAENRAREFGSNPANVMEINWSQLCQLRGQ